jgi:hypothetical protein
LWRRHQLSDRVGDLRAKPPLRREKGDGRPFVIFLDLDLTGVAINS